MKKIVLTALLFTSSMYASKEVSQNEEQTSSPSGSTISIHNEPHTNGSVGQGTSISKKQIEAGMLAEESAKKQKKTIQPPQAEQGLFAFILRLFS